MVHAREGRIIPPNIQSQSIRVAAVQYRAVPGDKANNLRELESLVLQADEAGTRLVVMPEMCTTGLLIGNRENAAALVETVPGPSTVYFANLAARLGIFLVFGLPTRNDEGTGFHNSQVLLSDTGQVLARYDKRHLYGPDFDWAEPGRGPFRAVRTALGVIGLGICFDINFSDLWSSMFLQEVNIFAFSTNWVADESPLPFWESMVRCTGISLVAANNWGEASGIRFSGESAVIPPDSGVLVRSGANGNTVVTADLPVRVPPAQRLKACWPR